MNHFTCDRTRSAVTCPAWCTKQHDAAFEADEDLVEHSRRIWSAEVNGREVSVEVVQCLRISTGEPWPVRVYVDIIDGELDQAVTLQLAAALMNAADLVAQVAA